MSDIPVSLSGYTDSDIGPDSECGKELLKEAASEASSGRVRLSDYVGPAPALLTPAMMRWYGRFVQPKRRTALDSIEAMFGRVRADQDAAGIFVERRLAELEDKRVEDKRKILASHREQNPTKYESVDTLKKKLDNLSREYGTLRAQHGREPVVLHWYYYLLLAVIGISEGFINFEAFNSLRYMTPVIALGATVVVAFLLALSSHIHGSFLKQWEYLFGKHRDDDQIRRNLGIFAFGTTGLSIVLGAVWYARSNYLADAIQATAMIGGTAPNWLGIVGGSLLLNMAVWSCGVILAYYFHDEDPEFPKKLHTREKVQREWHEAREDISKQLNRKYVQTDAMIDSEVKSAKGQDGSLSEYESYLTARQMYDLLAARDGEALSTLEVYRAELVRSGRDAGLIVEIPDKLRKETIEEMDIGTYAAQPLVLKYV
tara:strand:- start:6403 stop:7689 length:1287 start_codon:yes stop_codon:yes gene_type:complete